MLVESAHTPCPLIRRQSQYGFDRSWLQDDLKSTDIEYASLLEKEFRNAKPRRPGRQSHAAITIHEDTVGKLAYLGAHTSGTALLSRPAQRVSIRPSRTAIPRPVPPPQSLIGFTKRQTDDDDAISRQAISLAETPVTSPSTGCANPIVQHPRLLASHDIGSKKASVRAPLSALRRAQSNSLQQDIAGCPTGKENRPPGYDTTLSTRCKGSSDISRAKYTLGPQHKPSYKPSLLPTARPERQRCFATNLTSLAQGVNTPEHLGELTSKTRCINALDLFSPLGKIVDSDVSSYDMQFGHSSPVRAVASADVAPSVSSPVPWSEAEENEKQVVEQRSQVDSAFKSSVDDNEYVAPHGSEWLDREEARITERLNTFLSEGQPAASLSATASQAYHQVRAAYLQPIAMQMVSRMTEAVQHGGPRVSVAALTSSNITKDLALRQQWLYLWLRSFRRRDLMAAAEMITGQTCSQARVAGPLRQQRKAEIKFLQSEFLLLDDQPAAVRPPVTLHTTRVTRNLTLLWSLDQIWRASTSRLLFKRNSKHKSTKSVLTELCALLLPNVGGVCRVLHRTGYSLECFQTPLNEVC